MFSFSHSDASATDDDETAAFFSVLEKESLDTTKLPTPASSSIPPFLFDESALNLAFNLSEPSITTPLSLLDESLGLPNSPEEEPPSLPLEFEPSVRSIHVEAKITEPTMTAEVRTEATVTEIKNIPTESKFDIPALQLIAKQLEILAQNSSYNKNEGKLNQLLKAITNEKVEVHHSNRGQKKKRKKSHEDSDSDSDYGKNNDGSKLDRNAKAAKTYRDKKKKHDLTVCLILTRLSTQLNKQLNPVLQPDNEEENQTVTRQKSSRKKNVSNPKRSDRTSISSVSYASPSTSPTSSDTNSDAFSTRTSSSTTSTLFKPVAKVSNTANTVPLGKARHLVRNSKSSYSVND